MVVLAVHETWTDLLAGVTKTFVGASGLPDGVTAFEVPEEAPAPAVLVATTVKVKDWPLVSSVTTQPSPAVEQLWPWPSLAK